ncbi:MAG: FAD-binding oxidoreductase [Ornithinimicrobium sp.]|uniref:ferredoxin--NADP reductase n=1 Tax=Ornithinimicrobium sp. TaxID=1977084 RepID=UPI0026E0F5F7|nr:FAD-binding oxidoreductase [Ornithinimicrobium sp.]MDO5740018.1 FAD-binding oxidoreductase [Ornithinimicrobium sp.]
MSSPADASPRESLSVWADSWEEVSYRVIAAHSATPVVRDLVLAPAAASLQHVAGQYLLLSDVDHRLPERSYSIANAPRQDRWLRLLITRYGAGRTSTWAHDDLRPGDEVAVSGPFGTFTLSDAHDGPVLLLAAGSGLAPLAALAQELLTGSRPVTLIFSGRTRADVIDRARYLRLASQHARFDYRYLLTRPRGEPRAPRLPECLASLLPEPDLSGWEVFTAGPGDFVSDASRAALDLGAARAAVHGEEFFADPTPWGTAAPEPTERAR